MSRRKFFLIDNFFLSSIPFYRVLFFFFYIYTHDTLYGVYNYRNTRVRHYLDLRSSDIPPPGPYLYSSKHEIPFCGSHVSWVKIPPGGGGEEKKKSPSRRETTTCPEAIQPKVKTERERKKKKPRRSNRRRKYCHPGRMTAFYLIYTVRVLRITITITRKLCEMSDRQNNLTDVGWRFELHYRRPFVNRGK